jgi:uracil-DNA glycosylase
MGLSFSVNKRTKCPPVLEAIYKCLDNDYEIDFNMPEKPHGDIKERAEINKKKKLIHGDISRWANQGVLLLNKILTVQQGKPNSHQKKGWESFTNSVIRTINRECKNVVFMLWGKEANDIAKAVA